MITEGNGGWFADYISLLHDPSHWLFEITVTIVIDLVILYFGYQLLWKKVILPRLRRDIHEEIDRDHDLIHNDYSSKDLDLIRRMRGAKFGVSARIILPSGRQVTGEEMVRLIDLHSDDLEPDMGPVSASSLELFSRATGRIHARDVAPRFEDEEL